MLISVLYQLPLFIGYLILLGVLKLAGDALDLSRLGATFIGHVAD